MSKDKYKDYIEKLFSHADVEINSNRPHDIIVHDERFYSRLISGGSLAMGESYMDEWWDSPKVDELIYRIIKANLQEKIPANVSSLISYVGATLINKGSKKRAFKIAEKHYDLGNDLFSAMLDKRLVYTCGYWKDAQNLDEAEEAKLDLVCRKINLKAGQRVLDIGCGWGSFAKFAAQKYGVKVVGVTVSKEQVEFGTKLCAGLPVEIRLQDYRDVDEKFDHIVSLGMFEHVGVKNYKTYMEVARRCLNDEGLFLLHTIGSNAVGPTDPWIEKYIFPGGVLPSVGQITKAFEGFFVMEDWHNFGTDYDKTLMAWFENFDTNWPELSKKGIYDQRFYRMWKYYLLSCAASFRSRQIQLWQIVLSKNGVVGGYKPIR